MFQLYNGRQFSAFSSRAQAYMSLQGLFPGWWLGELDGRTTEPFISPERWDEELRKAGFSGTDVVAFDNELPLQINANILSTASAPHRHDKKVTLLYYSSFTPAMHEIKDTFTNQGFSVELCSLAQKPSASRDIIVLMDLEEPFFSRIDASAFEAFQVFVKLLDSAGILWLTRTARLDPHYALAHGVARTIHKELAVDFGILEIDNMDSGTWKGLLSVFEKFQKRRNDWDFDPEYEYKWTDGVVNIGRFHWYPDVQQPSEDHKAQCAKRLQIKRHGLLKTLFWEDFLPASLTASQVEIETHAIGLNFKVRV